MAKIEQKASPSFYRLLCGASLSFYALYYSLLTAEKIRMSDAGFKILGGIISETKDHKNSVILIKYKDKSDIKAIKVGGSINVKGKDLVLEAVKKEYIVASDQDKKVEIFKDEFFQTETPRAPVAVATPAKAIPYSENYKEDGFEREKDKIEMSEGFRKKTMDDLGNILMQASASPVIGANGIEGFELDQIEPGSIYQKAGLIDGDVVTSINGIPLTNVAASIKLLQSLKEASNVNFEFKRQGQSLSMNLNVR